MTDHPKEVWMERSSGLLWHQTYRYRFPNAIRYVPATDLDAARREVWEEAIKQAEGTPKFGYGQTTKEAIISNLRAARDAAGGETETRSQIGAPHAGLNDGGSQAATSETPSPDFTPAGHHIATVEAVCKHVGTRGNVPTMTKNWIVAGLRAHFLPPEPPKMTQEEVDRLREAWIEAAEAY
jgi:hypothetical protein